MSSMPRSGSSTTPSTPTRGRGRPGDRAWDRIGGPRHPAGHPGSWSPHANPPRRRACRLRAPADAAVRGGHAAPGLWRLACRQRLLHLGRRAGHRRVRREEPLGSSTAATASPRSTSSSSVSSSRSSCCTRRPTRRPSTASRADDAEIVDYFTSRGIRVMISIGGITYVNAWESALAEDAVQLGRECGRGRAAPWRGDGDRLRGQFGGERGRVAVVHRRLSLDPSPRSDRREPGGAIHGRPGSRRSLADRALRE